MLKDLFIQTRGIEQKILAWIFI